MASMCPVPQPQSVSRSHPEVVPPRLPHGIVTSNPWTSRYIEAAGLVSVSQGPPLNRQHPKLTPAHRLGQPAKLTPALAFNHPTTSPHRALSNGGDGPLSVIGRDITFRSRVSKLREAFELDWNMNRKERLSRRMEGIVNETLRLGSGHPHTLLQSGQQGDIGRGDQIANGLGQLHPQKIGQTKATVVPGSSNLSTQQPSGERMIQHPLEPESQHAPPAYDLESRAERIARYKAERRRQLAEQFGINIPDDADVRSTPKRNECLNIVSPPEASSRVSTSYSLLQRPGQGSTTLKMQEDYKTCASPSMKQDTVIQQASSSAVTLKDPAAHEDSADSPTLRCHQIWGHKAQVQRNMPVPLENKTSGGMEEVKLHLPLESRTCRSEESRGRFLSSSLVEKHQEDFSSPNVTSMSRLSSSSYDRTSIDHSPSLDSQQAIITSSRTEEVVTHPSADTTVLSALRGHKRAIARNGNSGLSLGKQPAITAYVDHEHEPRQCEDYKRHPLLGGGDSVITRIRDKPMTTTCSSNLLNTNRDLKRRERAHSSGAGWPSTPNNLKPFVKMSEGSRIVKNNGGLLHGLGNSQPSRQCTRLQSLVQSGISRECIRTCVEPSRQVEEPHRLNEFQELLQDGNGDGEAEVSVETRISVTELRSLFAETLKANRKSNVSSHEGRSRNGENRRLNERFHTQPITSTERQQTLYSASQQGVVSTSSQPLKRANTTDIMEGGDKTDEKARMSMAAKLSLFQAMGPVPKKAAAPSNTQKQPASLAWHQRSGPSRSRDVSQECPPHKSSKVLHSPTTCRAPVALKTETTSNREPSVHMEQDTYEEPDNSRLSLVEKMALFTRLGQAISSGVAPEQRIRRSSQRFQTQPLMADVFSPNLDHSNTRASEAGSSAIKPAAWTSQHPLIGAQVAASAQQSFSSYKSIQTTCLSGDVQSSVNRQLPFTVSRNGGATLVAVPTLVEPSRQAGSTFEKTPATYTSGPGRGAEEEDEEPDNSRLTLAEKMALFTQLSKGGPKTLVQRNRRSIPRFQTQPVTASEVHSASLATTSIAQVTSSVTYSQKQSSQQKIIVSGRPIQTGPVKAFKGSEGHHVPGIRAESDARETSMESPFHAWRERATIDPSLISRRSFDHMGDTDPKQKTDSSIEQAVHVSVAAETTAPWRKGLKTREKMVDTRKQQLQSLPKFPLSNVEQLRTSPVDTVTSYKRSKHEDHGWKERVVGHIDSKETSVRLEWQQRSQEIRQQQEIHIVGQREFAPLEKSVGEGGDTREKMGNEVIKVSFRPTESLSPARASHEVQKRDSKPPNLEWHSDLHHSSHWVSITPDSQETHDKYLDMVTESSSPRLLTSIAAEHRRAIRPVRKSARSRNPLRVLAEREDVRTDLIERGSPRRGDQTEEGLRAAEIQCSSETVSPRAKNRQTFQPLMLIQVKGRKHVQVRVVEPYVHSVGPGICAVLVTAQSCFLWLGHEANTSEKIKATKLAAQIQHGQELGCKASVVTVLEDRNIYSGDEAATFWTLLGTQHHTAPPCSPEKSTPCNEESYEHDIIATNCLFRLQGQCLVPDDKFWGKAPLHAILQTHAVLVFDFGTEIYTWIGEGVGPKSRRLAGLLAQQLWIGPYDYSTCRINPLGPWVARRGNGRPDWAVYSQIDQGRELLLFREKFLDWPGVQQEFLSKELIEEEEEEASIAQQLLSGTSKLADRDLTHQALDHLTGKQPITTSIEIWHITGTSCSLLEQPTLAHFYDGDSYLVMWRFKLRNSGGKETEEGSRSEYCTSFLWQGKKALQGSNESMAETVLHKCGCKSKMLVPQGKEPAAFLRLFHGSLVILLGSRDKKMELAADGPRLFCVCGDLPDEGCLLETPCKAQSLRSRASMLLLDMRRRNLHLWHGCRSSAGNRNLSRRALAQLHGAPPMDCEIEREATFTLHEFGEGAEPMAFWESLGSRDRSTYDCLLHTQGWSDSRPRLFHLSAPGERQVTEYPAHGFHCLPFVQRDLCIAAQPALFLMDAQQQVFLWKGWCLPDRERPGSWDAEIKRALLICHEYCKGRAELAAREGVEPPEAFVICAGHEPLSFTNLFPCWESWKCVNPTENKHGRRKQQVLLLEDVLERLGDPSRQCPPISDWLEHQSHVFG